MYRGTYKMAVKEILTDYLRTPTQLFEVAALKHFLKVEQRSSPNP